MVGPNAEPQAEELDPQQKLQWCLDNLGQRITAVGLGKSDARPVREWATSPDGLPADYVTQVDVLFGAAKRVADVYDDQTARAFLRSSNPYAGDRSLLELTAMAGADVEVREVVDGAVEAFLE